MPPATPNKGVASLYVRRVGALSKQPGGLFAASDRRSYAPRREVSGLHRIEDYKLLGPAAYFVTPPAAEVDLGFLAGRGQSALRNANASVGATFGRPPIPPSRLCRATSLFRDTPKIRAIGDGFLVGGTHACERSESYKGKASGRCGHRPLRSI